MKKQILTAVAVLGCLCGYAQTKGTSALGFGISSQNYKYQYTNGSSEVKTEENRLNSYSLGYGFFVKENTKLGIDLNYGTNDNAYISGVSGNKSKTYGAGLTYQHYYPLIKTLYAYAGGHIFYSHSKNESGNADYEDVKGNSYAAGVHGGLTWFVSRRFALETRLLSASASYSKSKRIQGMGNANSSYETRYTNFDLSTNGTISNLGFKIYILF